MDPADRRFFAGLFAVAASIGLLVYTLVALSVSQPAPPAPFAQPSVPSLIPPPLACLCGTSRVSTKPFSVACPYCRNTLSIQPSATGSVGQVVGEATATKVAK